MNDGKKKKLCSDILKNESMSLLGEKLRDKRTKNLKP